LHSVPWQLTAIRSKGRILVISYEGGGCRTPAGVRVTQTSAYVMIAAYDLTPRPTKKPMACAAYAMIATGTVELSQPLGHRPLYHAASGR
jgi:hypothetical protein